jgi:DNA-binding beta-propeller fold protein YncE
VVTVTTGYQSPQGALFDGTNVWVTDGTSNTLLKLNGNGSIAKTVTVGTDPQFPVFDGANIWVPNVVGGSVSVVRASSGLVIGTLTGNGLSSPTAAAFDGQRVLVTNQGNGTVSLWKAADLKELGSFSVGSGGSIPIGACSDGVSFWVSLFSAGQIARF